MVRYFLNLANVDKTHPGLRDVLEEWALTVNRTGLPFSRIAADLTLEQSLNADAASRQTGITSFMTSESARRRWLITRSARSAIIGTILEKTGLKSPDEGIKDLKDHRIRKDNRDMSKVLYTISAHMNPFKIGSDDNLYCLSTGKSVTNDIKSDLLHCQELGKQWCQEFEDGCRLGPARFQGVK